MFDRILTLIRKDLRTSTRDSLTLYILVSPIVIGLLLYLLAPLIENPRPAFVTTDALAQADRDALAEFGLLEVVGDRSALERRVLGRDDATGIVPGPHGELEMIIQGDEPEALHTLARTIIEHRGTLAVPPSNDLRRIIAALIGFSVPALLALVVGFSILDERINGAHLLYAVSPLRFAEYLAAKLGLLTLLSVLLVVPALAIPLGLAVDWPAVIVMVLAALPFAACYGLLIGVFAKDQLGSIGLVKVLSPIWTSLPILGFVLPEAWLWTQAPFANHWAVQGIYQALAGGGELGKYAALSLATGLPVLVVTTLLLRKRLGFVGASA
jgi:hypothetical protein